MELDKLTQIQKASINYHTSDIPSGHKIIPLHITDMTINGSAVTGNFYYYELEV